MEGGREDERCEEDEGYEKEHRRREDENKEKRGGRKGDEERTGDEWIKKERRYYK